MASGMVLRPVVFAWCLIFSTFAVQAEASPAATDFELQVSKLMDAYKCNAVYLDVGSNIGVQIRKLFEPSLYAHADPKMPLLARYFRNADITRLLNATPPVLPIFDEHFGPAPRCNVCAIGIEPNPRHADRLLALQHALRAAGAAVLILNGTAADVSDGTTVLQLSRSSAPWGPRVNDVGMTTLPVDTPTPRSIRGSSRLKAVRTVDLARLILFIRGKLRQRLSAQPQPPGADSSHHGKIVMKLDTEGAEFRLLPHLIARKAACSVDFMFLEWHRVVTSTQRAIKQNVTDTLALPGCNVVVSSLDDETFMYDGMPLPNNSVCEPSSWHGNGVSNQINRPQRGGGAALRSHHRTSTSIF